MRTKMCSVFTVLLTVAIVFVTAQFATAQEPGAEQEQTQERVEQETDASTFKGEVTVTGTLIPRPTLDSLSPVTVVSAEELTLTGQIRIEDLLTSLPQVFAGQNSTVANAATGTASIDLRLLGTRRTLVLINGRRMAFGDFWSADINAVPAPLVKRVDVLTGGASAVYGSDAVAGVVNFILDTDFEGVRGGVQFGFYQHDNDNALAQRINADAGFDSPSGGATDGFGISANVAIGGKLMDGRGHASVYVDYRKLDAITKSQRDYFSCSVAAGDDGPFCGGSTASARGRFVAVNPDNTVSNYTLDWVEDGGDGHSFRPWAGERFNYGPYNHIQRPDEKWNAGGFAHFNINDRFEPYLEVMFMNDYTEAQIAPSGSFGQLSSVNCDNPMLSDQQRDLICTQFGYGPTDDATVIILRRNVEGGPRTNELGHSNFRLVAGLRGDLNDAWSYDSYGLQAESSLQVSYVNDLNVDRMRNALDIIVDPATGEWVCRSGSEDGCVPWNIFQEGAVTQEAIHYISTDAMLNAKTRTQVVNITLTGDLDSYGWVIPSASEGVQVAVGGEYRSELLKYMPDEVFQRGAAGFGAGRPRFTGGFDVNELFFEALVPLVQDSRGFRDLSLEFGYRYSDYSTSGGFDTYKALLNWAFSDSWKLRGGFNRAVRTANISELFYPQTSSIASFEDTCANDPDTGVPSSTFEQCALTGVTEAQYGNIPASPLDGRQSILFGGNQFLNPEIADTVTAGVVWTPQRIPGLSVTADYYDIEVTDTISSLSAGTTFELCVNTGDPLLCSLIHRDAHGTLWLTPDGYVDTTLQNIGKRKVEGVDLSVSYLIGLGNAGMLTTDFLGTYLLTGSLTDPLYDYDCVGFYGTQCGQPHSQWRHRFRATWESNFNMNLSLAWRRIGSAEIDRASPDSDLADPEFLERARVNGIDKTRAYNWFDLAATYTFRDGMQLTLGVNNILDEEPPLMPGLSDSADLNMYANYDPLGRYIFANMRFNF